MFDAIGVSEGTRKPWTLMVSGTGQAVMIGLAVLIPLMSTEALPHRLAWVSVPEPPRALARREVPAAAPRANRIPFQMSRRVLVMPAAIPREAVLIADTEFAPADGDVVGVPGGIGDASTTGNGVIDSVVAAVPALPPPPAAVKPAPPAAIPRIKVGGAVQEGKLLSGPRPAYPALARAARVEGTVKLEAVIARDGTIMGLRAVSGHPLLVPAALAAVAHWVFRPTTLNGEAVEVATEIEVNFVLQH